MFKKKTSKKDVVATSAEPTPSVSQSQPLPSAVTAAAADTSAKDAEIAKLKLQLEDMTDENTTLKGQVHLLKFKVDLLVDMVTLANLDCDKLEDELVAVQEATAAK